MVFLYILLSIIISIVLLLCIKINITMDYQDEFIFEVRWLFVKYRIYPKKEKNKSEAAPPEEDKKPKKPDKKKAKSSILKDFYNNQGFEGVMKLIQNTASSLNGVLKRTLKAIVITNLNLYARITGEDSAKTAVNYGIVCSALYPALITISTAIRVKKQKIDIRPDFLSTNNKACFNVIFTVMPLKITNAAVIFVFQFLFGVLIKLFLGSRKTKKEKKIRKAD